MVKNTNSNDYLPLTEATYYIMLCLVEPLHGYGIMQNAEEVSDGRVVLAPGTLYGALSKLEKERLIKKAPVPEGKDSRRKYYKLTEAGKEVLILEYNRLKQMTQESKVFIERLEG